MNRGRARVDCDTADSWQVLETQFEIVNVQRRTSVSPGHESDSDNDNGPAATSSLSTAEYQSNEPIYQPKDPYEHRHLPHLIGTALFVEDDTLGIGFIGMAAVTLSVCVCLCVS